MTQVRKHKEGCPFQLICIMAARLIVFRRIEGNGALLQELHKNLPESDLQKDSS